MNYTAKAKDKKKSSTQSAFARYSNQVASTVLRGIKMAGADITSDGVKPKHIVEVLNNAGPQSLVWKPETLCSYLDSNFNGWDGDRVAKALETFHNTGVIDTKVTPLARQKFYAVRTIITSDSAHREWHIFEKVGAVFNGRLPDWKVSEPLDPIECAITVAIIDSIRPDTFGHEVLAYIAAACHLNGTYSVAPSKYLKQAEALLAMMNREETGRETDARIVSAISAKLSDIKKDPAQATLEDDFVVVQAIKLLAADIAGDEAAS